MIWSLSHLPKRYYEDATKNLYEIDKEVMELIGLQKNNITTYEYYGYPDIDKVTCVHSIERLDEDISLGAAFIGLVELLFWYDHMDSKYLEKWFRISERLEYKYVKWAEKYLKDLQWNEPDYIISFITNELHCYRGGGRAWRYLKIDDDGVIRRYCYVQPYPGCYDMPKAVTVDILMNDLGPALFFRIYVPIIKGDTLELYKRSAR